MAKSGRTNLWFAWFARSFACLAVLLSLGWSGHAAAQAAATCTIQNTGTNFQQDDAGTAFTYTFQIVDGGACPGTVTGTVDLAIDNTGGASAVPASWSGAPGDFIDITITTGLEPGTYVNYTVNCVQCVNGPTSVDWYAYTNSTYELIPTTATSFTALPGQNVPLGVQYLINNDPSLNDTLWSVDDANGNVGSAAVPPDGSGNASNYFYSYVPGTYVVTVAGACPPSAAPTNSCPPTAETYTIVVEDPQFTFVSPANGNANVPQNSSITLKVKVAGATLPDPDEDIGWTITSEPTTGDGSFTGGSGSQIATVTAADGTSQVELNVTAPGTYIVEACHETDGCTGGDDRLTFTIRVPFGQADLSLTKTATPSPVAPGGQLTYQIGISNNGPGLASQLVVTDNLPSQLTFASISTPAGWNCTTPAAGSGGSISCNKNALTANASQTLTLVTNVAASALVGSTITNSASVASLADPNGGNNNATVTTPVAASAPSLSVSKVLTGTADNDGSGSVSEGDRLDYQVTATNNGNTTLANVVVSDDHFAATQSCPSLAVNATCVLTGSYVVTASDVSLGTVTNIGSAKSDEVTTAVTNSVITLIVSVEPVTLGVGSGDGQSAPVNTPFPDPLTVVAGGAAAPSAAKAPGPAAKSTLAATLAPNITINWQVISGSATLEFSSSVTNSSGVASNHAFAGPNPGPVVIRAARADDPGVFVEFHLQVTEPAPKFGDLPGLDENQKALAEVLDQICSSGSPDYQPPTLAASSSSGLSDLQSRCEELLAAILTDPSGVIGALNQLFGDVALVQSESSLLAAQSQFDNIKARIAALRSGTNKTSFGGLAFRNASGSLPVGTMFQSLFAQEQTTEGGTPKEVGTDFSRWGFFASGNFGRGNADHGTLSPEYDFDIDGLTVGADYRKSDKLIFGGTLGYTQQSNDLAGARGSLDTKGWSASAYGTWYKQDSWYMDGVLSWGQNSYDVERHVRYIITTPSGETTIDNSGHGSGDGDSLTFALSVGRDFNKGGWGFGPYLRAMYTKMDFDTIEEHFDETLPGNGLALELDTRSVTSLTSTLGGKLTYAHSTSWGVLIPHLQLEWQHEFESDPAEVEMRFLFDPTATPFTIHGDPVDTDFFRFGVGMSFVMAQGRSGFFYYERLISRERFSQNSLALGIRLEF